MSYPSISLADANTVEFERKREPKVAAGKNRDEIKKKEDEEEIEARRLLAALGKLYTIKDRTLRDKETGKVVISESKDGNIIKTRSDEQQDVSSVVDLAQSKGWGALKVKGSAEFKQQIWLEAESRGIEVSGYKPTIEDKYHLAKNTQKTDFKLEKPAHSTPSNDRSAAPEGTRPHSRAGQAEALEVKLIEHGKAPYKDDISKPNSPYVKVQENGKQRKIWGSGLAKAIKESGAINGENVQIEKTGKEKIHLTDRDGKSITKTKIEWKVERSTELVLAHAAGKAVIRDSKKPLAVKELLLKSLDKSVIQAQDANRIPKVKVWDSNPEKIQSKKQEISSTQALRAKETRQQKQQSPAEPKLSPRP